MTSYDPSSSAALPGGSAGRRRALGRGPTAPRVAPPEEPEAESGPPGGDPSAAGRAQAEAARETRAAGVGAEDAPVVVESRPTPDGPGPEADASRMPAGEAGSPGESVSRDGTSPDLGGVGGSDPSASDGGDDGVFTVRLANFEGPFDLLLQLISKHKMDVTEVALSKVTDEFMAHIRGMGADWDLDETTEFLVVAATLLDLKAARLLPAAEVEDEGDLALLEARDLLFARLLQYRAYKRIAEIFNGRLEEEARRYPRTVGLEPQHAELLPEVVISIGADGFARLAVKAMQPKPRPQVYVDHIHAPLVSVQEQAGIVVARLRELGEASFRTLVEDTDDTLTVVARFLALLELYREKAVALDQETALGDLVVRWTGGDGDAEPVVTDEFDRPPERPEEEKA
ncbi:segregation and condensation protein A [Streptomyces heilongjiangensis]|uniref:Segregation and condensation protein A n=1 Tax=Streptomyces heilongjiangensis TaxID=945052 RepID=A0ABW1B9T5_9ACTN|nr:segregation/condensation protein A [Streptomyces heilongjiangensis]MDC2946571.1 segregation/condensation protein A [Streptomyces heilongjiangensis]